MCSHTFNKTKIYLNNSETLFKASWSRKGLQTRCCFFTLPRSILEQMLSVAHVFSTLSHVNMLFPCTCEMFHDAKKLLWGWCFGDPIAYSHQNLVKTWRPPNIIQHHIVHPSRFFAAKLIEIGERQCCRGNLWTSDPKQQFDVWWCVMELNRLKKL